MNGLSRLAAALALALPSAAQSAVHVVDDDPGPGVDFADIATALASPAFADGDVLLVADGTYSPFTIDGFAATVIADTGAVVKVNGTVAVKNMAPHQHVMLRGLETGTPSGNGLLVEACAGAVWIEACSFVGQKGSFYSPTEHSNGWPGGELVSADSVMITGSTFVGGEGFTYSDWLELGGIGGVGLDCTGSRVALHGSSITGGQGGSASGDLAGSGMTGGVGLRMASFSDVFAGGSTVVGGKGGFGGSDWTWKGCGPGGKGGDGAQLLSGQLAHVDATFTGGAGGGGVAAYGCSDGQPGKDLHAPGGPVTLLPGTSHAFSFESPVRENTTATVTMTGVPGELAFAMFALAPSHVLVPSLSGVLALQWAPALFALGAIDGSGNLNTTFPIGPIVQPFDGFGVFAQGATWDVGTGKLSVAHPSVVVVLNGAL